MYATDRPYAPKAIDMPDGPWSLSRNGAKYCWLRWRAATARMASLSAGEVCDMAKRSVSTGIVLLANEFIGRKEAKKYVKYRSLKTGHGDFGIEDSLNLLICWGRAST